MLNQGEDRYWGRAQSTRIMQQLLTDRMHPLTLADLDDAMRTLTGKS